MPNPGVRRCVERQREIDQLHQITRDINVLRNKPTVYSDDLSPNHPCILLEEQPCPDLSHSPIIPKGRKPSISNILRQELFGDSVLATRTPPKRITNKMRRPSIQYAKIRKLLIEEQGYAPDEADLLIHEAKELIKTGTPVSEVLEHHFTLDISTLIEMRDV